MASPDPREPPRGRPGSVVSVRGVGHSGYLHLTKKSGKLKLRKTKARLWFVFDLPTCKLMFSRTPQEAVAQPTGSNSLDIVDSTLMFGQEKNQFVVSAHGQDFLLTADTHESMMKWMSVLQDCRDLHRKQLDEVEIDMITSTGSLATGAIDIPGLDQGLVPGMLSDNDSDQEGVGSSCLTSPDGPSRHSSAGSRTESGVTARQKRTGKQPAAEDYPDYADASAGVKIEAKHASVVLDPAVFLSELSHHHQASISPVQEDDAEKPDQEEEDEDEKTGPASGVEGTPLDGDEEDRMHTGDVPDGYHPNLVASWKSATHQDDCLVVRGSVISDASSAHRTSTAEELEVEVPVADAAQPPESVTKDSADVLEADDALTFEQSTEEIRTTEEFVQSFHSGYTMWEHFDFRKSEIGRNDLVNMNDDDEESLDNKLPLSPEKIHVAEKRQERREAKQIQSLKSSLSQLEKDLRMALQQIALLEGREEVYREKLTKIDGGGPATNKPDSGPVKKQLSLLRKRSATNVVPQNENQQELDDLKMAADRYHEQNIVMTKEVVQLVEARREEQRRSQQYSAQCKLLSRDMIRLKISYVDVLQESFPIRLKSAPGDRWDEDRGMDPLEAKNQQRVYGLLAECHRYDKTVPVYNRSIPGGNHTEGFGFTHSWDEYNVEMHSYLCDLLKRHFKRHLPDSVAQRQEKNWSTFMADDLFGINKLSQSSNELKSLIINGIPAKQRAGVWKSLIAMRLKKYREAKGPGYYASLQGYQNSHSRQIQVDLHRTLTTHCVFVRGSEEIAKLQRILLAYSMHNPHVGYCQGMNMLVAFGMLILHDEEEVFWFLVALVERYLPDHYFDNNLVGAQADQLLMKELLEEKLPNLAQHLDFYGIDVAMVTFNWCLTVFVDAVPTDTLLRIWDCFMFEGSRVLFRFSLAILHSHAPRLRRIHDPITLFQHLKLMAKLAYNEDELTKLAYISLHPFSSRKHLAARREHFMSLKQTALDEDDAARVRQRREQAPSVAFKSAMQRSSNRSSDASKRVTVWECAAKESDDMLWLCEGDREAGYVSVLQLSSGKAALIDCDLQSRIMSICKLQNRHMLLGTLLGTVTAFLSHTGCELFTVQLKDSVLSLAAMEDGKTFAGLADGTLVVFEKFTAQAISREVLIQSGVSITSLLLVSNDDEGSDDDKSGKGCTAEDHTETAPIGHTESRTAEEVTSSTEETGQAECIEGERGQTEGEPERSLQSEVSSGDVPDAIGKIPRQLTEEDGVEGKVRFVKGLDEVDAPQDSSDGSPSAQAPPAKQERASVISPPARLVTGTTLWCGCGNKLLVLDAETLEEVTSIQLSPYQRNNISHLRLTEHGVWTVMHRTATIDLWDKRTFERLLSVDCSELLRRGIAHEDPITAPISYRATAFAVGRYSVWLGTANGYLLICEIVKTVAGASDVVASENSATEAPVRAEAPNAPAEQKYSLKLVGLHRVSEDALRLVAVSRLKGREVAVHCPQHAAPFLWTLPPTDDPDKESVWRSHSVDCETATIEDLLHLERRPILMAPEDSWQKSATRSMDFLAEAELIDPNEIVIRTARVDEKIDDDED